MGEVGGLIGPAMSLAGGGKGGGGGGGGGGQGVSPQEAALAQYAQHQAQLNVQDQFANTGTGHSTMSTQAIGGTRIAEALQLAGIGQQNANVFGQAAQDQAAAAGTAAGQQAGQQAGGQGFSSSQGTFGQPSNTTSPTDETATG